MPPQAIDNQTGAVIPAVGEWPVEPQRAIDVSKDRIWVDGCFDFAHHGHAGAMLQAKKLGSQLVVGIHSDEDILRHKGPPVMTLEERVIAVEACRWSNTAVPHAPYVTSIPWIDHYGCHFVVHGDDASSDENGEDSYRFVKSAGRFEIVKRTPDISTTNIVGRMLVVNKDHFLGSIKDVQEGRTGPGGQEERKQRAEALLTRIASYATDAQGQEPHVDVLSWNAVPSLPSEDEGLQAQASSPYHIEQVIAGKQPMPGQRVVYVDGGFDLFSVGHIEFLKKVVENEEELARTSGWYDSMAVEMIQNRTGEKLEPAYLVIGVHDDYPVNNMKGLNYPIMNVVERGLCVLQYKHVNSVIFGAPIIPTATYLDALPYGRPHAVYHGPTSTGTGADPYADAKALGIFHQIGSHKFTHIDAKEIVNRVLNNRVAYETRQKAKGEKTEVEAAIQRRELLESRGVSTYR